MIRARAALVLAATLLCTALVVTSAPQPAPVVWPMDVAWTRDFPLDPEFSLVMGDATLFVVETDRVSAYAWSDGSPRWTADRRAAVLPVASEGRLFIADGEQVLALSEATGQVEWSFQTGMVPVAPVARAGWLVVPGTDGVLRGVSVSDGRVVWSVAMPFGFVTGLSIDGDLIAGGFADGSMAGWRITDGALRWTQRLGTRPKQVLAASGRVFVAGDDGRLIGLNQRNGDWQFDYDFGMPIVGRLAADARNVYAATIDNSVRAHGFNGNQRWRQPVASRIIDGLVVDAESVFVPQSSGEIRLFLAASSRAGRLAAPGTEANATGRLAAGGHGQDLRLALTTTLGSNQTVIAYKRTGLGVTVATAAPPGPPLEVSLPAGKRP